ncbi:unnamed protein product [Lactuca virosa]|uniref:HRDC domain-containing protein n=1 Tax=Lactuca virosa TaxID=75947 RepID=A0AAU9PP86_9ASTR|nr:unnamed protein product [Lactuca virosa]
MDPSFTQESRTQKSLVASSVKSNSFSSMSKISGCSGEISSNKNINFYVNFEEFKNPIQETSKKSQLILEYIPSEKLWGKTQKRFPKYDLKYDEVYNWLININHEMFERFDASLDEIKKSRYKEQKLINLPNDTKFQLVNLKKEKVIEKDLLVNSNYPNMEANHSSSVKVVSLEDNAMGTQRPKVSFHMNWIPKPQDVYNIVVNNVNQPFQHVWLKTSEDGSRLIHPLEKHSVFDFVNKSMTNTEPLKPPPVETTPLKLVQDVKDLKELVAKLHDTNEFAVDLEHNQYRSFQGLTCLMQISTRTEDFIVDTLKLRVHIGPYLREIFKDPTKRKVMHGADKDILWLQRDFGIYVCNMFDTGQALCEWRDIVARAEDESTGYVLPNKILIEIAKKMPITNEDLRGLLTSNHPHIERNLTSIVSIIQNSMYNAAEFEGVARRLKEEHMEMKWFEEVSASSGAIGANSFSNIAGDQSGKKAGSVVAGVNWNIPMNGSGFTNTKVPLQNMVENICVGNAAGNRKLDLDPKLSSSFPKCLQTSNGRIMMKQKEEDKDDGKKVIPEKWIMNKSAGGCKDGGGGRPRPRPGLVTDIVNRV